MDKAKNMWQRYHVVIKLALVVIVVAIILANVNWEPWKNGLQPAIDNLNLDGVWPLEKLWGEGGTITISNFSWKEFDLYVSSMGNLHFVLSKSNNIEGKLKYTAENRQTCEVTIELSSFRTKGEYDEILIVIADMKDNALRIGNCFIDQRILPHIE